MENQNQEDKYFNEEGLSRFQEMSAEEFTNLIVNLPILSNGNIEKTEDASGPTFKIKDIFINSEYFSFDAQCSSEYEITFENCYFTGMIFFDEVNFKKDVCFSDCFFDSSVHFHQCTFQDLDIRGCYFKSSVRFSNGKLREIKFSQQEIKDLTISGSEYTKFQIGVFSGSFRLNKLVIINNNPSSGPIEVTGVDEIGSISIYNVNHSDILLEEVRCNNIYFQNFTNLGQLKIVGLHSIDSNVETHFGIWKSSLGKAQFYRLNLASFSEVNITDSNLMESVFVNTTWPKQILAFSQHKIGNSDSRKDDNESQTRDFKSQQRETYRQLKFVMDKQGDSIQEQLFYSKEMNLYNDLLHWDKNFWDKLILWFSQLFSRYGTHFGQALFWFLFSNWIILIMLIGFYHFEGLTISCKNSSWEAFSKASKLFINQLNPLHKFNKELAAGAIWIDFLGRILSSYLIYHLIRTSRRFVR